MSRKRLVVCCDGTWNKAETMTSISRLHDLVEPAGRDGLLQLPKYIEGVGAGRFDRFRGGLFGVGLSDNIKQAYKWLVQNYAPGDEIFCFGFSRGAYTARSLCGLLAASGLLQAASDVRIDDAFEYYRTKPNEREKSKYHRRLAAVPRHTFEDGLQVKMLGVFDTVGSLGVPVPFLASLTQWRRVAFHDTRLSALVEHAFQALAIDERRGPFRPALWTDVARDPNGEPLDLEVAQVWFAGVHSDVGGGYRDKRLADVPFTWMLAQAARLGLYVRNDDPALVLDPDPYGRAHDSLSAGYKLAAWWPWIDENGPRPIGNGARPAKRRIAAPEALHDSAEARVADSEGKLAPDQAPYRPINLVDRDGRRLAQLADLPVVDTPSDPASRPSGRERRRSARRSLSADCTVDGAPGRLVNLSEHGVGVHLVGATEAPLAPGQAVLLEGEPSGRQPARLVWRQGRELGLAFT